MKLDVNEIYKFTRENMMGMALRKLRECKEEVPYELQSQYDNVEMLIRQYYLYDDKSMTAKVRSALLELADDMQESMAEKSAIKYEYSIKRNWHISNETLIVALAANYDISEGITIELDAQLIVLFRQVWLSGKLDSNVIEILQNFVTGEKYEFARKVVIWAMMMRCIRHYDIRLVEILMSSKLAESYVAVVMIAMACQKRIDCDLMSIELFRNYFSDKDNEEVLLNVYNNVMRTFETESIANEMRDNILPVVKKNEIQFNEKGNGNVLMFDENGLNPEWEERLEESGVMDKMRKINDMQFDGADIHYETFKMVKSAPFFMDTAHWFFPFTLGYHQLNFMDVSEDDGLGKIPKMLNLCDSDRYSLFLMLKGMNVGGLQGALAKLGLTDIDNVREQLGNEETWKETDKKIFNNELRYAVMNLYRFYNIAPNHSDIISPFARVMPAEGSELGYSIVPAKIRFQSAKILFKAREWSQAHEYYQSVVNEFISDDMLIYQKMGYCSEKLQHWRDAIDEYEKSDIVVPDDIWTLRHAAFCHMQIGESDIAAGLYRKVLELDKDSVNAIVRLSDIYLEQEDYSAAKPLLYEMEFRRGAKDDLRKLGYCLFMMGQRKESANYLGKVCMTSEAVPQEYMMRGIASGDQSHLSEACAIIYDVSAIMDTLNSGYVKKMMDRLSDDEREMIKSTINKIILEQ